MHHLHSLNFLPVFLFCEKHLAIGGNCDNFHIANSKNMHWMLPRLSWETESLVERGLWQLPTQMNWPSNTLRCWSRHFPHLGSCYPCWDLTQYFALHVLIHDVIPRVWEVHELRVSGWSHLLQLPLPLPQFLPWTKLAKHIWQHVCTTCGCFMYDIVSYIRQRCNRFLPRCWWCSHAKS